MKYGMPTLIEHDTLDQDIALAKALRLDFIEINMNLPAYTSGALDPKDASPRDGLFFTLHLDENLNPFDFNPLVAEAYTQTAERAALFAAKASIPVLNMHMSQGVHFKLPGEKVFLYDRYFQYVAERALAFRTRMERAIGRADVTVCVENTAFSGYRALPDVIDILLKSDRFALTYDAGHDYTDGMRAKSFYAARAARVTHMHLHGANEKTCHLPISDGGVDAEKLLALAEKNDMRVVLETKNETGLADSVNWLRERNYLA